MDHNRRFSLLWLALLGTVAALALDSLPPEARRLLAQPDPATGQPSFTAPESLQDGTRLRIDGTPIMTVINRSLEDSFEGRYPGSEVELAESSTDDALATLQQGEIDLAATGRPLSDAEKAQNLAQVTIDREKIAIIVGRDNPFRGDLEYQDFVRIFQGEITNWSEVGGPDLPMRFIDRPANSDTRQALAFYEVFQGQPFETGSTAVTIDEDDTAAVVRELRNDGISYAISGQVNDQDAVRVLSMNGTLPTDPRYPYSQPRGYVYQGEASIPVEAFLGHATSPAGEAAIVQAKDTEKDNVTVGANQLPGDLAVSPDGQYMVRGSTNGDLTWLDSSGNPTTLVQGAHSGTVTAVTISSTSELVATSAADGTIRRWDRNGNPTGEPIQSSGGPITALTFSPDGQTLISGNADGTVERWNPATGESLGPPIAAHTGPVKSITYPPGGINFLTGGEDGKLAVWNPDGTPGGTPIDNAHGGGITAMATTPTGETLVTGGGDGTVRRWDRATLTPQGDPTAAHTAPVTALALGPDGQLSSADQTGSLALWNPDGTPATADPIILDSPATALAYTDTGELVVASSDDSAPVERRNAEGQPLGSPVPDLDGGVPPALGGDLLGRIQNLPRSTWWILAAVPALLFLAGILGAIFGKGRKDADGETNDLEPVPGSGLGLDFSGIDQNDAPAASADVAIDSTPAPDFAASADVAIDGTIASPAAGGDLTGALGGAALGGVAAAATVGGLTLGSKLAQAKADLTEGKQLARARQYDLALQKFDAALEATEVERYKAERTGAGLGGANAIMVDAFTQKGHVLAALNQTQDALDNYNAALGIDSRALEAWIGKGRLLTSMGQYEEAIFCYDTALEIDERAGHAWAGKGQALQQLGRTNEAQTCMERASQLGVASSDPWGYPAAPVEVGTLNEPVAGPGPSPGTYDPDIPLDLQQQVQGLPSADATLPHIPPAASVGMTAPLPTLPRPVRPPEEATTLPIAGASPVGAADPDVPLDLLQQVQGLPSASATLPHTPPTASTGGRRPALPRPGRPPEEGGTVPVATAASSAIPDVPPELLQQIQSLPSAEATLPHTPPTGGRATLPPEVLAAIGAPSPMPLNEPPVSRVMPTQEPGSRPVAPSPAAGAPSLPPEMVAALASSATVPAAAPIRSPSPAATSWLRLGLDRPNQQLDLVWQLDGADRARALGQGGQTLAVRLYDVTGVGTDAPLGQPVVQQRCTSDQGQKQSVAVPRWDRIYVAQVGYLTAQNQWLPLATSAEVPVLTP